MNNSIEHQLEVVKNKLEQYKRFDDFVWLKSESGLWQDEVEDFWRGENMDEKIEDLKEKHPKEESTCPFEEQDHLGELL